MACWRKSKIEGGPQRGLEVEGIVVNQFQARASLPQQMLDELIAEGLPVLPVYLASSVRCASRTRPARR
jgi:hypothetical protein